MSAFPPSVCFRLKLLRYVETAGQKVLTYTLLCGTPGKKTTETLIEYLDDLPDTSTAKYKNNTRRQKENCFDNTQKEMIRNDASCNKFDISLLWKAITEACEGWTDPANYETQSLVKKIKDTRNKVVHEAETDMSEQEFLRRLDELRDIFVKTLDATKVKYNTDEVECDEKKKEVRQLVRDIRDERLSEDEILKRSVVHLLPYFREEAYEKIKQKLSSAKLLDPLCFLSGHEDRRVDVEDIFSEIIIQDERKEKKRIHHLKLLTLAQDGGATSSPHLILVEGDAGSGKTTLLVHTISEYLKEKCDRRMEGLEHFHFLFWVVCREESSPTFESLVKRMLSDVDSKYGNLLMPLLTRSNVLIIIDGLDEMNDASRLLIRDILNQAKDCPNFTLLSTSRPEATQAMKSNTPKNFKLSCLKLEGVTVDMRAELALRHFRWLCSNVPKDEAHLEQVMQVVQEVVWKEMFRLPLNILFLVTYLFFNPKKVTATITQTELYQNSLDWCVEKLRHRLAGRPKTPTEPVLGIRIKHFLCISFEIALNGLIRENIYLIDDEVKHLIDFCEAKDLPVQDTLPAFYSLRRVEAGGVTRAQYHAPHKGLQDFFAACHIRERLNNNYKPGDIRRMLDSTAGHHLQLEPLRNMLCHLLGLLSSTEGQHLHTEPSRNMFCLLLRLMSCQGNPIVTAVDEIVDLLQESGVQEANDWLSVLADTEAHPDAMRRVAHHINRRRVSDYITIRDGTVHIAAALLPLIRRRGVTIRLARDQSGMEALFLALGHHALARLWLEHHYRHPRLDTSSAPLLQKIPRSDLWRFVGHLDADHLKLLPEGLNELCLVVVGNSHAKNLLSALEQVRETFPVLESLRLHVPVSAVTADSLIPLPNDGPDVRLRLSGVSDEEVEAAVKVATALCPRECGYWGITFPGAKLGFDGWRRVLEGLAADSVKVRWSVGVPRATITVEEERQLYSLARSLLGCGILRLSEEIMWY